MSDTEIWVIIAVVGADNVNFPAPDEGTAKQYVNLVEECIKTDYPITVEAQNGTVVINPRHVAHATYKHFPKK